MAIYVDALFKLQSLNSQAYNVGERTGHQWCHMFCDGDLDELHRMAQSIGLKRAWFQDNSRLKHYDLTPNKRAAAIARGAKECDRKFAVAMMLI